MFLSTVFGLNLRYWNALHTASDRGNEDVVSALVDIGMDLNVENVRRGVVMTHFSKLASPIDRIRTPLHIAVIGDHRQSVRALVDGGAKRSLRDSGGMTPRALASNLHRLELLEMLMPESERRARREGYCWRGRRRYYFRPEDRRPD
jgi:ankyrin repeat protein